MQNPAVLQEALKEYDRVCAECAYGTEGWVDHEIDSDNRADAGNVLAESVREWLSKVFAQ